MSHHPPAPEIQLPPGYALHQGSSLDRSRLVQVMQRTYTELHPGRNFEHLALTVDAYLSKDTPLWWVQLGSWEADCPLDRQRPPSVACLWLGTATDQVSGDRHTHIFLLYVTPDHRRRGIGRYLMHQAETWASHRGDRQISLQVFSHNQPALQLYQTLGYYPQSIALIKDLSRM